ncbi:hypothetical protein DIPPA_23260 [Diplonema papillatum]|nr:hypothetical protein DIPPA_23260 [Diplonema papillatum]
MTPSKKHDGSSPLAIACRKNRLPIVERLIAAGADPFLKAGGRHGDHTTPFYDACARGHSEVVEKILPGIKPAQLDEQDHCNASALSAASASGCAKLVRLLINAGAQLELRNNYGDTALIRACSEEGREEVVKELIKANAEVDAADQNGKTCLMRACGLDGPAVVQILIEAKAQLNLQDDMGETALIQACGADKVNIVQQLLKSKVDVNVRDKEGRTALFDVSAVEIVKALIKAKLNVNAEDNSGGTALSYASSVGRLAVVQELIDAGADVNLQDSGGNTALMRACETRHVQCVEALIQAKADLELKNDEGQTALYCALAASELEAFNKLLKAKARTDVQADDGTTLLFLAAKGRMRDIFARLLLSHGSRKYINCSGRDGTALMGVCVWGDTADVQTLLDAGADVNAAAGDGTTALRVAISYSRKAVFAMLVAAGANVNARDSCGETALHEVSEYGRQQYISLLLAAGAQVDIQSNAGETPLMLAVKRGQRGAATLLLQAGSQAAVRSESGCTALAIALLRDNVGMRELLEAAAAKTGPFAKGASVAKKALRKQKKKVANRKEEDDGDDCTDEHEEEEEYKDSVASLKGMTICFTGTLSMSRADAKKKAEKAGATVRGSVTKAVQILVVGEKAGSKADAGVLQIDEEQFEALTGGAKSSKQKRGAKEEDEDEEEEEKEEEDDDEEEDAPINNKATTRVKSLKGKTICFTGKLRMPRADAKKKAEQAGATVKGSVTKAVDILVVGENAGSKADAGVDQIDEDEFEALVGGAKPTKVSQVSKRKRDAEEESEEEDDDEGTTDDDEEEDEPVKKKMKTSVKTLKGKTICFTGKLRMPRADAKKKAEKAGATVKGSVTKAVDILVVGENAGSKADAGVDQIDEDEFEALVGAAKPAIKVSQVSKRKRDAEEDDDDDDDEDEEDDDATENDEEEEEDEPANKKAKTCSVKTLKGKTICFTGKLRISRADAKKKAAKAGATVKDSVTKAVDILVVGENAGSKADAGVDQIDEDEFEALVDGPKSTNPTSKKPAAMAKEKGK